MSIIKRGQFYHYHFFEGGRRYRGSTKQTKPAAARRYESDLIMRVRNRGVLEHKKAPTLSELVPSLLKEIEKSRLEPKTKTYYRDGWKLLEPTTVAGMRVDKISRHDAETLRFRGSPAQTNCALRTLRKFLGLAAEKGIITAAPKVKLAKEYRRELTLTEEYEKLLLPHCGPLLRDIIVMIRDTGLRNRRELFRMRVEDIRWLEGRIFIPSGKTGGSTRYVPLSPRVRNILQARCFGRTEGWVFPAKKSKSGHLTTVDKLWRAARADAGLPEKLVLYCGRHDFGTQMYAKTKNIFAVMKTMGHADVKTTQQYQHQEVDEITAAIGERVM